MAHLLRTGTLREAMGNIERRYWAPFIRQTDHPMEAQQTLLRHILNRHADTVFGEKYGFKKLRSYHDYRRALPIQGYEDLRPYIEAQDRTGKTELNAERPGLFAQTSGTTGQPKLIPILRETGRRLRTYQRLFTFAQYQGIPDIFKGRILVLSGQRIEGRLPTGTAYGSMSGLLYESLPISIKQKDVLSPHVRALTDVNEKYLRIAACMLAEPSLSVLASPNPSTFLKLMELIRQHYSDLVEALSPRSRGLRSVPRASAGRLAQLKEYRHHEGKLTFADLWPDLRAVITWMGGNCGVLIPRLKSLLSENTALIEMGYLSSECLGSLNVDVVNNRCVPTFHDNVFEFVPLADWDTADPRTLTMDQLEIGEKYQVLVTTPAGLYRYAMNDIVEVTGRFNRTPTIRFVQKGKGVTNITGEKLYEHHVTAAVDAVCTDLGLNGEFYVMLADVEAQQYTLYIESAVPASDAACRIEQALGGQNVEFKSKRESGRLRPVVVRYLREGTADAYRAHCLRMGQRESQFKLVRLQYRHDCSLDFSPYLR
jgi:GH3 auxin-responsive promoter